MYKKVRSPKFPGSALLQFSHTPVIKYWLSTTSRKVRRKSVPATGHAGGGDHDGGTGDDDAGSGADEGEVPPGCVSGRSTTDRPGPRPRPSPGAS